MSTLGKRPASSASPPPSKHVRTAEYGSSSQDPPLYLPYPPLDAAHAPALPTFQQPVPVQTYSHDATHKQCFDDSAMRYLRPDPPLGADLGHRRAAWVRKQDTRGRLDGLLRALRKAQEEGRVQVEGVVSWRGVMTVSGCLKSAWSRC
jgi:RAT1-interacting protein